jgi:nicotinamidase-related amidase
MVMMSRTALLVIDMVRDFADLEHGKVANAGAAAMVPVIADFVEQARQHGARIIWVIDSHRAGKPDWELEHVRAHCDDSTIGVELAPGLEPQPDDYVITKRRYSAFAGTDLDLILRDNRIERLILTGTKTNVCIRATAQDAFQNNYHVIVPRECVATDRQHLHEANLEDIDRYLGRVMSAAEALALLAEEVRADA